MRMRFAVEWLLALRGAAATDVAAVLAARGADNLRKTVFACVE